MSKPAEKDGQGADFFGAGIAFSYFNFSAAIYKLIRSIAGYSKFCIILLRPISDIFATCDSGQFSTLILL